MARLVLHGRAEQITESLQTADGLRDALVRVPTNYRAAVLLHDMEGLTVPQVAVIQGVTLSAAKQRVRRGRLMVVNALDTAGDRRRLLKGVPMNCWDARVLVCDYLDNELPVEQRRTLEAHLEQCPTCPPLYSSIVASRHKIHDFRDADSVIPEHVANRLSAVANSVRSRGVG